MSNLHPDPPSDEEEEEEDAREHKLGKVFDSAQVLTNSEVGVLLTHYVESKKRKETNFQLHPTLKLAQEYAERFGTTKNSDMAQRIRELLVSHSLREFEMGAIANLTPDEVEEAKTLVPSLATAMSDVDMESMLQELQQYRQSE